MQGEYNESSMDQQCVEDENYVPGCKVQDRQNPDGEGRKSGLIIDPTNPDNVPIGDYLRYICPEVNPAQDNEKMDFRRQYFLPLPFTTHFRTPTCWARPTWCTTTPTST